MSSLQADVCRYVEFTKRAPSPLSYHHLSPTRRTRAEATEDSRNAVVVLNQDLNSILARLEAKAEKFSSNINDLEMANKKLTATVSDLSSTVNTLQLANSELAATDVNLSASLEDMKLWRTKVHARELVASYHRKKGKKELKTMLEQLKCEYRKIQGKSNLPLKAISSLFTPSDFMAEVRRLWEVKMWLENPSEESAPPFCHGRISLQKELVPLMLQAVEHVLAKNKVPLDYIQAVTVYYKDVNSEVHKQGEENADILQLGNAFISSLIRQESNIAAL